MQFLIYYKEILASSKVLSLAAVEYWSVGVLENCEKHPEFFHHSNTPVPHFSMGDANTRSFENNPQ
jgi:hypothetical protein